jgi:hypothetical protein
MKEVRVVVRVKNNRLLERGEVHWRSTVEAGPRRTARSGSAPCSRGPSGEGRNTR